MHQTAQTTPSESFVVESDSDSSYERLPKRNKTTMDNYQVKLEKDLLEESLLKFKRTTEEEIRRLRRDGVDLKRAIDSLVDKIR